MVTVVGVVPSSAEEGVMTDPTVVTRSKRIEVALVVPHLRFVVPLE